MPFCLLSEVLLNRLQLLRWVQRRQQAGDPAPDLPPCVDSGSPEVPGALRYLVGGGICL